MNKYRYRVVTTYCYSNTEFYREYSDLKVACDVYDLIKPCLKKGESVRLEVYEYGVLVRGYECKGV